MTSPPFRLLDTVALLREVPEQGLRRGQVGTLVEPLAPGVWLVGFSDDEGRTYAIPDLTRDAMMTLHFRAVEVA